MDDQLEVLLDRSGADAAAAAMRDTLQAITRDPDMLVVLVVALDRKNGALVVPALAGAPVILSILERVLDSLREAIRHGPPDAAPPAC